MREEVLKRDNLPILMRSDIEFLYKPEKPVQFSTLRFTLRKDSFSQTIPAKDQETIDNVWEQLLVKNPKMFSKPGSLATILANKGTNFRCGSTEFREYVAVSRTGIERTLNPKLYDQMRVLAVSAYLKIADGTILVHRRSETATHVPNILDASCGGLCKVEYGTVKPVFDLREKMQRELGLYPGEVTVLGVTNVHSCADPDYSGTISFALETTQPREEICERIPKSVFKEYEFVPARDLPDYIIYHYIEKRDMSSEGAATLIGALETTAFDHVLSRINDSGKTVSFIELQ